MSKDLGTTGFATHSEEFNGNYRGQVVNNLDPLQAGRVQVQVLPMFVGITDSTLLPWSIPAMPLSSGAGSGYGSFSVPNIGSWVWVFFEQGSIYQPVYFAEAVDPTRGVPSFSSADYPNSRGFKTSSGISVVVDDVTKTYTITHPTGAFIVIDTTGQILINGTNIIVTTNGTTTWTGTGNINVTSSGNISVAGETVNINPA
jgi:hypothetical protein